jgi:hypothetical protein
MPRAPLRFRQCDVTRAIKALRDAGVSIARVEVGQDGVNIVPGEPGGAKGDGLDIKAKLAAIDASIRRPLKLKPRGRRT